MKNKSRIFRLGLGGVLSAGLMNSAVAATVLTCTNPVVSPAGATLPGYLDLKMGTLEIDGGAIKANFYLRDTASPVTVDAFTNPTSNGSSYAETSYSVEVDIDGQTSTGCSWNGADYSMWAHYVPKMAAPRSVPLASILTSVGSAGPNTQYSDMCRPASNSTASVAVDAEHGILSLSANIPGASAQTRYSLGTAHFDGTSWLLVSCAFGTPGSGTLPGQDLFQVANGIIPPDAVTVSTSGTLTNLSLTADLRIDDLQLTPAAAASFAASGYNVYVVANVPGGMLFQKSKAGAWGALSSPLGTFLENVQVGSADQRVRIEILRDMDLSSLRGTEFYIGYGTSDVEMLQNRRYRGIYKVPASGTAP